MALIVVRYVLSLFLGLIGLLFLSAAIDLNFNITGWQDEVITRQTQLKQSFERAGRYTESFRQKYGQLPNNHQLQQWAVAQSWPESARGMDTSLHIVPGGEGCYIGDEVSVRGYSLCYWRGGPTHWKYAPQSGDHNLRLRAADFRPSLDYAATSIASFLIPFLLAFWLWPKQAFRRQVLAVRAAV